MKWSLPPNLSRYVLPTGVLLAVTLAGFSLWPATRLNAAQNAAPAVAATPAARLSTLAVMVVQPRQQVWPDTLAASGPVMPWQEAWIAAEISGLRIVRLHAEVGQVVRRGEVLATLADDGIKAELAQREAELAKARAQMQEAKANGERARSMKAQGAWSEQLVMQHLTNEQSAIASVAQAEALLQGSRVRLSQTRILAPDDGMVTSRNATLGAVTGSGQELFRLVRQRRLEWRAEINASQLGQVVPGQSVRVRLPDGRSVGGQVRMVAPTLDNASRNATVHIDLPIDSIARSGMFAQGSIEVGQRNAITVPQAAVIMRDGRAQVFALETDSHSSASSSNQAVRVRALQVETGRQRDGMVEVAGSLAGSLATNARIVVDGAAFLRDGDWVQVKPGDRPVKDAGNDAGKTNIARASL